MKNIFLFLLVLTISHAAFAADVKKLTSIFQHNYNSFYRARMCGENIGRLVEEAKKHNLDLNGSYVLKLEGGGFLETSGFYTRSEPNDRAMLGYFHYILVADGYVFDFDLNESLVLKFEDYIRLQFTPAHLPYVIFGINYKPIDELPSWIVTRFEVEGYPTRPQLTWKKKLGDIVDIKNVMKLHRVR